MKVLVTGADGMLGTCVCKELLKREIEVVALVQSLDKKTALCSFPLQRIEGDILNIQSIRNAMQGVDYVIHIAASTSVWPRKNPRLFDVNVQGTKNVAIVAKEWGIKRFIHIGSASSFGNGSRENPANEQSSIKKSDSILDYVWSKHAAQEWLLNQFKEAHFPVIIINPTFMIGPFDALPSSGKILLSYFNRQLPAFTSGGKNFVNTEDVATAVVNALTMGKEGECYITGGENLSFKEFLMKAATLTNRQFTIMYAPKPVILFIGFMQSFIARITGRAPQLSFSMAKSSLKRQYFSSEKAVRELNFPQYPIEFGISSSLLWFKENGKLK